MLQGYHILTVTHRNTRLNKLGSFAVPCDEEQLKDRLHALKAQFQLKELMYLATCNRVMYFFDTNREVDTDFVTSFFQSIQPLFQEERGKSMLEEVAVHKKGEAIAHLFEVAASIDSLVVGEREILRQLREAFQRCQEWGLTGDHIRLAMKYAVEAAKEVYAQTRIGEKPVSVVSLAIQKLLKANVPKNARIMLVGAGQTNTLVTKFLLKYQFNNVVIFNRNIERAQVLAEMINGRAYSLDQLASYQEGFDVMIVCTGANEPLITSSLYTGLLQDDRSKKLLIDLAIPNNISREVVDHFNVQYIEIEDLRYLAKENLNFRENEVIKGRQLLRQQIEDFGYHFQHRQIEKAMHNVPAEIKAITSHALDNVFKKELDKVDDQTRDLIYRMMHYMERQCISVPMKAAKKTAK